MRMSDKFKDGKPFIHCITNYVTAHEVANMILAAGGSPVMADDPREVEEITRKCDALCMNLGTFSELRYEAMRRAHKFSRVSVLDLVGAGASALRAEAALNLMDLAPCTVVKGNISELKRLSSGEGHAIGVDAHPDDEIQETNLHQHIQWVKALSCKWSSIVVVTGALDLVTDGHVCYVVRNGHPLMQRVTGMGCQLTGLIGCYIANQTSHQDQFSGVLKAVCLMGIAGEIGFEQLREGEGNASYGNRVIDAVFNMEEEMFTRRANYEIW